MKRIYTAPVILESNGIISMTSSQLAALGVGDVAGWDEFWEEAKDACQYSDFNVNDPDTWPDGFNLADDQTWDILVGF